MPEGTGAPKAVTYPRRHKFGKPFGAGGCGQVVESPSSGRKMTCGWPASAPCHVGRARDQNCPLCDNPIVMSGPTLDSYVYRTIERKRVAVHEHCAVERDRIERLRLS